MTADLGQAVLGVAAVALGAYGTFEGIRTWQGREKRVVTRMLADAETRARWVFGGRTLYQTYLGGGLALLGFGLGFAVIGAGATVRGLIDPQGEPAWWWAASLLGVAGWAAAGLYLAVYLSIGVPDGLRPPAQRGQPKPGQLGPDGRGHPLDELSAEEGTLDLGPDPTRPPWTTVERPRRPATGRPPRDSWRARWDALVRHEPPAQ